MVLGIFMCATLVGALWYIAGIGDAVVYRERLQEAADAAAMSAAALNARGMNLLVFINLIMACVLAIRVALKVLQVTLVIAETIFAGCALVPAILGNVLEPVCAALIEPTGTAIDYVQDAIDETRDPINNTLKGLHNAQKGIARVVPGGSAAGSLEVLNKYKPFIIEPSAASPSPDRLKGGLPVADGTTDKLCAEAGKAMGALIDSLIPIKLGAAQGLFSSALESVAGAGSSYFCELGGSGSPPDFSQITNKTANDKCDKEVEKRQKVLDKKNADWHAECSKDGVDCLDDVPFGGGNQTDSEMSGPTLAQLQKSTKPEDKAKVSALNSLKADRDAAEDDLKSFDHNNCVNQEKKALNDKINKLPPSQQSSGQGMEPMKVDDAWFNGGGEGQTLSWVTAEDSLLKRSFKGVKIGAWKDKNAPAKLDVPKGADTAYAQAEYFYDCSGAWSDCNQDQEAMWHLRWRARLRRYNNPWNLDVIPVDKLLSGFLLFRAGETVAAAGKGISPIKQPENAQLRLKLIDELASVSSLKAH